jgi:hypothetical protein
MDNKTSTRNRERRITGIPVAAKKILACARTMVLPLLLSIYPSVYLYGLNAKLLLIESLVRMLIFNASIALIIYMVILTLGRFRQPVSAGNAAFIFLIFFNMYGLVYQYFLRLDAFQFEHYIVLPPFILAAIYAAWGITKLKRKSANRFWNISTILVGILILYNSVLIVSIEVDKARISRVPKPTPASNAITSGKKYPDIYFFVFDEFSAFQPIREYWHYEEVDNFEEFLTSRGFYIDENSHSNSALTFHQLAERLNYQEFPYIENESFYYDALTHNRVMAFLKSLGYTTIAFEENKFGFQTLPPMEADYLYEYGSSAVSGSSLNSENSFDEFGGLVLRNTVLKAFPAFNNYVLLDSFKKHVEMVTFTANRISTLNDIPSPKFTYVHLWLPHSPFMFYENGVSENVNTYNDWNYYLDNYKFTIKYAEQIVNDIFKNSDPGKPPIIILQSDHGPRNLDAKQYGSVILDNFPAEYSLWILNALYIPGYDVTRFPKNMDPTNTFSMVFRFLFPDLIVNQGDIHQYLPLIISPVK